MMLSIEPSKENVTIIQHGRHIEVKTPTVEMSCDLPLGCAIKGHGCQVRFNQLPIECTLSPYDIRRDSFVGIGTMISEQTRHILYQYDENRWQVRLGRTKINLYEHEVHDVCSCLDIIGQKYAEALRVASCLLETWEYSPAMACGKTGVQLLMVHTRTWQLMQRFAREFHTTAGKTAWHCFRDFHRGDSITIGKLNEPAQATIWAMPPQSYNQGDYIPLLYEYPDNELLASEEHTHLPWKDLSRTGVWTAAQTEQWLTNVFIPQVFSHYQVYQDASITTSKGFRYQIARSLAPEVFDLYRERFDIHSPTFAGNIEIRTHIEDITNPVDLIPYIGDLRQWFATYPVVRIPAKQLRPYYLAIAEIVQQSKPSLASLNALTDMFAEMSDNLESKPNANGWRRLNLSFEAFVSSLSDQVKRINGIDYEYTACADILSLALTHILEYSSQQIPNILMRSLTQAVHPLWEQARFDERYVIPSAA